MSGTIIAVRGIGLGPSQTKVTRMRVLQVELTVWWEETGNNEIHSLSNDSKC